MKKVMTFNEAKAKLNKIANGNYCTISYDLTISNIEDLPEESKCTLYIDGFNRNPGSTWEEAFKKLKMNMFPKKSEAPNMAQAPE